MRFSGLSRFLWLFDFVPVRHFDNVVQKGDFFELRDYEARPVTVGAC